jgi:hypothetical protein
MTPHRTPSPLPLCKNIPAGGPPSPVARLRAEARAKACAERAQFNNSPLWRPLGKP